MLCACLPYIELPSGSVRPRKRLPFYFFRVLLSVLPCRLSILSEYLGTFLVSGTLPRRGWVQCRSEHGGVRVQQSLVFICVRVHTRKHSSLYAVQAGNDGQMVAGIHSRNTSITNPPVARLSFVASVAAFFRPPPVVSW